MGSAKGGVGSRSDISALLRDPGIGAMVGFALVCATVFLLGLGDDAFKIRLVWVAQVPLDAALCWFAWRASRVPGLERVSSRFMRTIAFSALMFTIGDTIQLIRTLLAPHGCRHQRWTRAVGLLPDRPHGAGLPHAAPPDAVRQQGRAAAVPPGRGHGARRERGARLVSERRPVQGRGHPVVRRVGRDQRLAGRRVRRDEAGARWQRADDARRLDADDRRRDPRRRARRHADRARARTAAGPAGAAGPAVAADRARTAHPGAAGPRQPGPLPPAARPAVQHAPVSRGRRDVRGVPPGDAAQHRAPGLGHRGRRRGDHGDRGGTAAAGVHRQLRAHQAPRRDPAGAARAPEAAA